MERQLDPEQLTEDVYGNNAAVICPSCGKVYVVSGLLNGENGRKCPKCGGSTAIIKKTDGRWLATISWADQRDGTKLSIPKWFNK